MADAPSCEWLPRACWVGSDRGHGAGWVGCCCQRDTLAISNWSVTVLHSTQVREGGLDQVRQLQDQALGLHC